MKNMTLVRIPTNIVQEKTIIAPSILQQMVKTILEPEDDAAHVEMGGDWHIPTSDQFEELISGTSRKWIENYQDSGVNGRLFTSKTNGNSIFIPASGTRIDTLIVKQGEYFTLWSSSGNNEYINSSFHLHYTSKGGAVGDSHRYLGYCLRGVIG